MRFVSYEHAGTSGAGVLDGEVVVALPAATSVLSLLQTHPDALAEAGSQALDGDGLRLPLPEVHLLPPVTQPPTIRDFMTYEQHIAPGYAARGAEIPALWYEQPVFYFTNPYAVIGCVDDVPRAPGSRRLDFEAEVAAVLHRPGRDLDPEQAADCIVGYTVLNDWSARDLQVREREVGLGPVKAKDFATTMGPYLVTVDELAPYRSGPVLDLGIEVRINDELFGSDRTTNMAWTFGEMVAFASQGADVRPGDVFGSGTCANGCLVEYWARHGADSRPPLQDGDVVEVRVEGLGVVRNRIVAGAAPRFPRP